MRRLRFWGRLVSDSMKQTKQSKKLPTADSSRPHTSVAIAVTGTEEAATTVETEGDERSASLRYERELQKVHDAQDSLENMERISRSNEGELCTLTVRPSFNWSDYVFKALLPFFAVIAILNAAFAHWLGLSINPFVSIVVYLLALGFAPAFTKYYLRNRRFLIHKRKQTFIEQRQTFTDWKSVKTGELSELTPKRLAGYGKLNSPEKEQLARIIKDNQVLLGPAENN